MAFYDDKDENELNQQQGNIAQNGVETSKPSGDIGGAPGGATSSTQTQAASSKPDNPGNFVGISQYLNANKNQSAKLGDQTAGVINNSADQARQGVAQLKSSFDKDVGSPLQVDQQAINQLNAGAESLNDQQKQTLKNQASAQYNGPKELTDEAGYGAAQQNLTKAQQNIDSANTEQGRMGLVKNINSGYRNKGIDTFDNALLQGGAGREKVEQAAKQNQDLKQDVLGQQGLAAQQKASDVANSFQNVQDTTKGAIQGATQNFQTGVNQRLQDAIAKALGSNQRITQDLADPDLNDETLGLAGLHEGDRTWGLNLNDYLNQANINNINAPNVASAQDYARYAALADLAGTSPDAMFLNPANAPMAGTAPTGASFATDKLKNDLQAKQTAYDTSYKTQKGIPIDYGKYSNIMGGPLSAHIPGALTDRRDIDTATPEQLENYWLPIFNQANKQYGGAGGYGKVAEVIKNALDKWKSNQNYNTTITRGLPAAPEESNTDAATSKKELLDSGSNSASEAPAKKLKKG